MMMMILEVLFGMLSSILKKIKKKNFKSLKLRLIDLIERYEYTPIDVPPSLIGLGWNSNYIRWNDFDRKKRKSYKSKFSLIFIKTQTRVSN